MSGSGPHGADRCQMAQSALLDPPCDLHGHTHSSAKEASFKSDAGWDVTLPPQDTRKAVVNARLIRRLIALGDHRSIGGALETGCMPGRLAAVLGQEIGDEAERALRCTQVPLTMLR